MRHLFLLFNKMADWSSERVEIFGAQYTTFALFGILNYPFAFLVLYYLQAQDRESFALRLIACLVCIPLLLHRHWPLKIKRYLPLYWHMVVLYSIPFFGMVMLYRQNFSLEWLLNMLLGIFLFILLVDWLTFLILLFLGAFSGLIFFYLTGGSFIGLPDTSKLNASLSMIAYLYLYAIVIGVLFARNRERIYEAKMQTIKSMAFFIAHEMRTPLACVAIAAQNLKKFMPIFEDAYVKAREAGIKVGPMHAIQREQLVEIPLTMEKVSYNAQNIINMLLMKVQDAESIRLEKRSISRCITTALEQYPMSEKERKIIKWDKKNDFFIMCKEEMFLHIFFNLLKNSLHQISLVEHGRIDIWTEVTNGFNFLYFKDNGRGISKRVLPKIFDKFISDTEWGTGMGLAYCKMAMNSFNGDITCNSEEGRGAEFVLKFPMISEDTSIVPVANIGERIRVS